MEREVGNGTPEGHDGQGGPDSAPALLHTALAGLRERRQSSSGKDPTWGRARTDVT